MGAYVSAYATNTIAMGTYACADDRRSFVWSGIGEAPSAGYFSNGDSTFNVNPAGGISGVYVGVSSLADHLSKYAKRSDVSPVSSSITRSDDG